MNITEAAKDIAEDEWFRATQDPRITAKDAVFRAAQRAYEVGAALGALPAAASEATAQERLLDQHGTKI